MKCSMKEHNIPELCEVSEKSYVTSFSEVCQCLEEGFFLECR